MSTVEQRIRLAELLERAARGEISSQEAVSQMKAWHDMPWKEKVIDHAGHALLRFEIDEDIRAEDPSYASMQKEGLLNWAKRMREK